MAIDPVCGMEVEDKTAEFHSNYGGKEFYFCGETCQLTFEERPEQFAASSAA